MKKFLALLLVVSMVLGLAACGDGTQNNTETTEEMTEFLVEEIEESLGEEIFGGATEEIPQAFFTGSSTGNTYWNEFIGIRCDLDLNWAFVTDNELHIQNQTNLDVTGNDYLDNLPDSAEIYDMLAYHSNEADGVGVTLVKLSAADLLTTEEQYLAAIKDPTVEAMAENGITIDSAQIIKIQFAGEEHTALTMEGGYIGYDVYEYLVAIKCDGFMACVTVCTWDENTCMDVLNQFEAY